MRRGLVTHPTIRQDAAMPLHRKESAHARGRLTYLGLAATDAALAGLTGPTARRARYLTKPLLMPALASATRPTATARTTRDPLQRRTTIAQAFSWGGDVALLGTSERAFLAGVASFFAAHVAYIGAFTSRRDTDASLTSPGPTAAAATWLALAPVMAIAAGRKDPALRLPITAYAGILSTMFATSTTLAPTVPKKARKRIVAGTALFLLSDSLLGLQEFVRRDRSPALETAVMATYTAGQYLIADGVSRAHNRGGASA
jgi:uncharacterized membrane protein YhhN